MRISRIGIEVDSDLFNLTVSQPALVKLDTSDYTVFVVTLILQFVAAFYLSYISEKICKKVLDIDDERERVDWDGFEETFDQMPAQNMSREEYKDFILTSRTLRPFPVALSLVMTAISSVSDSMTIATDVYFEGTQTCIAMITFVLACYISIIVYIPIYDELKVETTYEYIELRFGIVIKNFLVLLYIFQELLFLPTHLYLASMVFASMAGFNYLQVSLFITLIAIVLIITGGTEVVVYSQMVLAFLLNTCFGILIVKNSNRFDGPMVVVQEASDAGKFEFFNLVPKEPGDKTFFDVFFGSLGLYLSDICTDQDVVTQFMTVPNLKKCRIAMLWFCIIGVLFLFQFYYAGLLMFSHYEGCDPYTWGTIKSKSILFPLYAMNSFKDVTGLAGFFLLVLVGLAVSDLVIGFHSLALIFTSDVARNIFNYELTKFYSKTIAIICILASAVLVLLLSFAIYEKNDYLISSESFEIIGHVLRYGIFTIAILFPQVNHVGALLAIASGTIFTSWLAYGINYAYTALETGQTEIPRECFFKPNITFSARGTGAVKPRHGHHNDDIFPLFKLDPNWIVPLGIVAVILTGLLSTYCTKETDLSKANEFLFYHGIRPKILKAKELKGTDFMSKSTMSRKYVDPRHPLKAAA